MILRAAYVLHNKLTHLSTELVKSLREVCLFLGHSHGNNRGKTNIQPSVSKGWIPRPLVDESILLSHLQPKIRLGPVLDQKLLRYWIHTSNRVPVGLCKV